MQQHEHRAEPAEEHPTADQQHAVAPLRSREHIDQQNEGQKERQELERGETMFYTSVRQVIEGLEQARAVSRRNKEQGVALAGRQLTQRQRLAH